jgi:calcineurin-like phosphoesterase family protein
MQRKGTKHLIVGNHDGCFLQNRNSHSWQHKYLAVFESVQSAARRKVTLEDGRVIEFLLSHFPYDGDHTPGDRYEQWRLRDQGLPVLHGHTHVGGVFSQSKNRTLQMHIGVDAWNFTPVSLQQVIDFIAKHTASTVVGKTVDSVVAS